jgi:ABC-type Zn2+ transport system substrate-binding protein/surface adhesin
MMRITRVLESKEVALLVGPNAVRFANSILSCLWLWHISACLYWFIAVEVGDGDDDDDDDDEHDDNDDDDEDDDDDDDDDDDAVCRRG